MKLLIFNALIALTFSSVCSADLAELADNQIDDEYNQLVTRGRYSVKACKPCGRDQCQVMGMQRFAEPRCEAFGGLGAPCRPFQEAENKTLSFPNSILYCNNVYMQFCPCSPGLVCDLEQATCGYLRTTPQVMSARRPQKQQQQQPYHQRQQQAEPRNSYQFTYAQPERFGANDEALSFGDWPEVEEEREERLPVALEPMVASYEPEYELTSSTVRRRPQWPWAVARFH